MIKMPVLFRTNQKFSEGQSNPQHISAQTDSYYDLCILQNFYSALV